MRRLAVGPMGAAVKVGKRIEFTREEVRQLMELAHHQELLVKKQQAGWITAYVIAHTSASKLIRRALERSHGPEA